MIVAGSGCLGLGRISRTRSWLRKLAMVLVTVMTGTAGIAMATATVVMTGVTTVVGTTTDTEIIIGKEGGRGLGSEEPDR